MEELQSFLRNYDLGAIRRFRGIAEGIENSNFELETERGRFVLTLFERRVEREDLPYFLHLMQALSDRGFPCPPPIADRRGIELKTLNGRPALLVGFLEGAAPVDPEPDICRQGGAALARLHAAAQGFPERRANGLGLPALRAMAAALQAQAEAVRPGLAALIEEEFDRIGAAWPKTAPAGPIHADFFPDNVLFEEGRFVGAIDFYFACDDLLAFDLTVALNSWGFTGEGVFRPREAQAFIQGYETVRPLLEVERAALPLLARLAALRFLLTRLADWGREDGAALVRRKDPHDFLRRLDFLRSCGEDPFGT